MKKFIAVAAALVMVSAAFAACTKTPANDATEPADASVSETVEESVDASVEETTVEAVDASVEETTEAAAQ